MSKKCLRCVKSVTNNSVLDEKDRERERETEIERETERAKVTMEIRTAGFKFSANLF